MTDRVWTAAKLEAPLRRLLDDMAGEGFGDGTAQDEIWTILAELDHIDAVQQAKIRESIREQAIKDKIKAEAVSDAPIGRECVAGVYRGYGFHGRKENCGRKAKVLIKGVGGGAYCGTHAKREVERFVYSRFIEIERERWNRGGYTADEDLIYEDRYGKKRDEPR